jgi:hypothetical protein
MIENSGRNDPSPEQIRAYTALEQIDKDYLKRDKYVTTAKQDMIKGLTGLSSYMSQPHINQRPQ